MSKLEYLINKYSSFKSEKLEKEEEALENTLNKILDEKSEKELKSLKPYKVPNILTFDADSLEDFPSALKEQFYIYQSPEDKAKEKEQQENKRLYNLQQQDIATVPPPKRAFRLNLFKLYKKHYSL